MRTRSLGLVVSLTFAALPVSGTVAAELAEGPAKETSSPTTTLQRGEAYAHLMRSFVSVRRGEVGAAIEEIHRALELVPDSPDLLTESASLLLQWTGRRSEAATEP